MAEGGQGAPHLPPRAFTVQRCTENGFHLGGTRAVFSSTMFTTESPSTSRPPVPPRRTILPVQCNRACDLSVVPPTPSSASTWTSSDLMLIDQQVTRPSVQSIEALFLENTTCRQQSSAGSTTVQQLLGSRWSSQQQYSAFERTEMTHSNSAPNFSALISAGPSPSHGVNLNSAVPSKDEIEKKMFGFMRKKQDNNLIDLACETEVVRAAQRESARLSGNTLDDLLAMFDPLREAEEEVTLIVEQEPRVPQCNAEPKVSLVPDSAAQVPPSTSSGRCSPEGRESPVSLEKVQQQRHAQRLNQLNDLKVVHQEVGANDDTDSFWTKVKHLRSEFLHEDHHTNIGLVVSPTIENKWEEHISIKLDIMTEFSDRSFCFTCSISTSIEHIISNTICSFKDDLEDIQLENYVLKVRGLAEYFTPDSFLKEYEYIHQCYKSVQTVCLTLMDVRDLKRPWSRTLQDDGEFLEVKTSSLLSPSFGGVSYDSVSILIETFQKEAKKLLCAASSGSNQPRGVIQAVKAICAMLSKIEILEIIHAVEGVKQVCSQAVEVSSLDGDFSTKQDMEEIRAQVRRGSILNSERLAEAVLCALLQLQSALRTLISIYCRSFCVNFGLPLPDAQVKKELRSVTTFQDTFLFSVSTVHQLKSQWIAEYDHFQISCELRYGADVLSVGETRNLSASHNFFDLIVFDEWVEMKVFMKLLPRETSLYIMLHGIEVSQDGRSSDPPRPERTLLAWCGLPLFNSRRQLVQGSMFLGLWSAEVDQKCGPAQSNDAFSCPVLRVQFPEFDCSVVFPEVRKDDIETRKPRLPCLDSVVIQDILDVLEKDPLSVPTAEERRYFWDNRHYVVEVPQLLPKVFLSVQAWSWGHLPDIYFLLTQWKPASPIHALTLLLPLFPDTEVRKAAVKWIKNIGSDELCDHLPQLVQALRFETWEDSPVAWFLLERSLTSVRVAHQMYWLLKQNMENPLTLRRMKLMVRMLLVITGRAFRAIVERQEEHLNQLCIIAENIKDTRDSLRLEKLLQELEIVHSSLEESLTCLPLNPAMEVCGIDVKSCSYFTSNTLPLKIVYRSTEANAKMLQTIYKVGDDLRQDMLTLQMIRIMDKFWLKEGLDLKIITFACVATGSRKGMVEMVTEAETLRKIQTEHGLTGSFKDRPISEWLQKHNTSELEYQQAVENFTLSCAGYCVATYVLGICDRHNDNIMLKTSGHMFHIDFGKFLGDSQMFVNIRRDRAPFVLTPDMVYVINGGEKPTKRFQTFIDLCCRAFNIVRQNSNIFVTLFQLMVASGIPGVTSDAVNFIQKSLLLGSSEIEATAHFTRLIEESLSSRFTQFNFFVHNIAQLRFTGDHNDGLLLSFVPRTFTHETDGRIISLGVVDCQKRYEPEKHYTYVIRVIRECQTPSMSVFRTFAEFLELYQKLVRFFPLAKFYPLSRGSIVGRSNTREVALKRKVDVEHFLRSLMTMAEEVSHCSLVYTFFHPLLRDQEGMTAATCKRKSVPQQQAQDVAVHRNGPSRIKLSMHYKGGNLLIMVMHAENLFCERKEAPDAYVKTYLHKDVDKTTKKKTKVVSRNSHPSFMELLAYEYPLEVVREKLLEVSVWDYDRVQENEFLGATAIDLWKMNLTRESVNWYDLHNRRFKVQ
ncbi:phosphatidylinositol 4-phosphate 3-kinase C2 domain-containing subunit alpha-like [Ornithodoros turicata]|uniref:phosphatidylinositol 4-phosphate 3-kinase C2 domain-containing subunit alpha-like n=1 Tax=Ornithodoros turicata TaxID=34597 RepID=UPI00313A0D20